MIIIIIINEYLSKSNQNLAYYLTCQAVRRTLYLGFCSCHKSEGKGLDTCYSATYMSQTRDQQRFTISEVAADWHEPMVPQRIMWPSIARANGRLDPRCS